MGSLDLEPQTLDPGFVNPLTSERKFVSLITRVCHFCVETQSQHDFSTPSDINIPDQCVITRHQQLPLECGRHQTGLNRSFKIAD
jgi:hypothetical protein